MAGFNWSTMKLQFDHRHDFESEESSKLKKIFKHTNFVNIPEAWVIVIDGMLRAMRDPGSVKEVKQEYGQLIVEFREGFDFSDNKKFIQEAESKIYNLDEDINHEREAGIEGTDEKILN